MGCIKWHLRQLLPLTYRSHYSDQYGRHRVAIWRMWLGQVFAHEDHVIESSWLSYCGGIRASAGRKD